MNKIINNKRTTKAVHTGDIIWGENGSQVPNNATRVCNICIHWMDGIKSWEDIKELKYTNSIELSG